MAAGTEGGLDLIMNGKKLMSLFWRFESSHGLFSPSGRPVRSVGSIVDTLVAAVFYSRSEALGVGKTWWSTL